MHFAENAGGVNEPDDRTVQALNFFTGARDRRFVGYVNRLREYRNARWRYRVDPGGAI